MLRRLPSVLVSRSDGSPSDQYFDYRFISGAGTHGVWLGRRQVGHAYIGPTITGWRSSSSPVGGRMIQGPGRSRGGIVKDRREALAGHALCCNEHRRDGRGAPPRADGRLVWYHLVIGIVAALCTLLALFVGHCCGAALGRRMEVIGGSVLVAIGFRILYQHICLAA